MGYRDVPVEAETCLGCRTNVDQGTALCPACGAPIDITQFAELELKLKPHLRQARTALGVATGLFGLCLSLLFALGASGTMLMTSALGTALFGACFVMSAWRPLAASAVALATFSALQISVIAQGRMWLLFLQGWLVITLKVVLVVLLATGVRAGLRVRDIRRQSRPRDRKVAVTVIAATLAAGIVLGLWTRAREEAEFQRAWMQQVSDDNRTAE
jgi:hypothetical protein